MPDSSNTPIGRPDPYDPFGTYRAEEIHEDKREEQQPPPPEKPSKLALFLIHTLHKILALFHAKKEGKEEPREKVDLKGHLIGIRDLFESLKTEDHSQDVVFLGKLGSFWSSLLDDELHVPRHTTLAKQIYDFIRVIREYPKGSEHSLGYYLSEYAGQTWMPFPYMDMIRNLWDDCQKNLGESSLSKWVKNLDEMIDALNADQLN